MKKYCGYSITELEQQHALHTAIEIQQQPNAWLQVYQQLQETELSWRNFIEPLLADSELQIILTGAGSSAFIGNMLVPWLKQMTSLNFKAIATTDIVAAPLHFISQHKKTLLVSFARSGNSPESVASLKLCDQLIPDCHHLIITCNREGFLAKNALNSANSYLVCLPDMTNDLSFAMTSSFSSMALSALLLLGYTKITQANYEVHKMISLSKQMLQDWSLPIKKLAQQHFSRVIYLGNAGLKGLAQEAALKMLELTAGLVVTTYDSPLGFRHGPKFTINNQTLVVVFLSNDPYIRQYDLDLLHEISNDKHAQHVIALNGIPSKLPTDTLLVNTCLPDQWLFFIYLIMPQLLAFETSLAHRITPDNPSPSGEVNRVVQGVSIHPYPILSVKEHCHE